MRKRHNKQEIVEKLQYARRLEADGKTQQEIAKSLGISVMTYFRWRKQPQVAFAMEEPPAPSICADPTSVRADMTRIGELKVENARLRKLVTDLLLEKVKLEEVLERRGPLQAAG